MLEVRTYWKKHDAQFPLVRVYWAANDCNIIDYFDEYYILAVKLMMITCIKLQYFLLIVEAINEKYLFWDFA